MSATVKTSSPRLLTVSVDIDNHYKSKIYTTASKVSGNVIIRAQQDVAFTDVDIQFLGIASSRLDFVSHYLSHSIRTFLNLPMPVPEDDLPSPRIFQANRTYVIPFEFVVPSQLTLHACTHHTDSPDVKDRHLQLPPSVNTWEADDLSPDPTHIEYLVRARVSQKGEKEPYEACQAINILPAFPEEPPIHITSGDIHYCPSKEKPVRKNFFTSNLGTLRVSARQPRAIMLAADGRTSSASSAHVELEFYPSKNSQTKPPEIHSVSGKLVAESWWGGSIQAGLPNMGKRCVTHFPIYSKAVPLFSRRTGKLSWSGYESGPQRRTSESSNSSVDSFSMGLGSDSLSPSEESSPCSSRRNSCFVAEQPAYRAKINAPFSLPMSNKKVFLPSFYTCNLSRTYSLELTIITGSAKRSSTTLCLPLQIGVEPSAAALSALQTDELPSFETALLVGDSLGDSLAASAVEESQRRASLPSYGDRVHRFQ
ncbi:unnamed protein product [Clonostachys rhizophaga]|uniref:Arrestin-like N-terminal domain-containing protein n=1 Tax=Clonostachys rhizophaga TaxID=160324 RepID=A0A9N9VNX6_9HYPO|nr:unnamed protein product [Clonostachys rhizophaga]